MQPPETIEWNGKTPTGAVVVRPGNYVFYDYTQCEIGSCEVGDCALTVLSSVVSSQPGARHSVIDAGALSLSLDRGPEWAEPSYGRVFGDYEAHELDPRLRALKTLQLPPRLVAGHARRALQRLVLLVEQPTDPLARSEERFSRNAETDH